MKRKDLSEALTWMNFTHTMLGKRSHTEKSVILFLWSSKYMQISPGVLAVETLVTLRRDVTGKVTRWLRGCLYYSIFSWGARLFDVVTKIHWDVQIWFMHISVYVWYFTQVFKKKVRVQFPALPLMVWLWGTTLCIVSWSDKSAYNTNPFIGMLCKYKRLHIKHLALNLTHGNCLIYSHSLLKCFKYGNYWIYTERKRIV